MALYLEECGAQIYPSKEDFQFADSWLAGISKPLIAIHPGSGSPRKNWGLEKWIVTARELLNLNPQPELLWVGGEADEERLNAVEDAFGKSVRIARHLPLPHLAAVLARCRLFLGHDSGISHLAAAVGTRCVLLFGPTDPAIWAPANAHVVVMEAADCDLSRIQPGMVYEKVRPLWDDSH
jgi:heptosyltransferase-2